MKTVTSRKDSHLTKFSIYVCIIINAFTENNMRTDTKVIVAKCFLTMGQDRRKIFQHHIKIAGPIIYFSLL